MALTKAQLKALTNDTPTEDGLDWDSAEAVDVAALGYKSARGLGRRVKSVFDGKRVVRTKDGTTYIVPLTK